VDPFWEKVILIVVDKLLLAAAGAGIAYLSALAIERYRRNQAVVLELGKLRAQAYCRLLSFLGEQDWLISNLISQGRRTENNSAVIDGFLARLDASIEEMNKSGARDIAFLDQELGGKLRAYNDMVHAFEKYGDAELSETERVERRKKLRELHADVIAYLPPLPKP
jgi:hypothetical protein